MDLFAPNKTDAAEGTVLKPPLLDNDKNVLELSANVFPPSTTKIQLQEANIVGSKVSAYFLLTFLHRILNFVHMSFAGQYSNYYCTSVKLF